MKKVLAVFLVALLAFCTFSCGKKGICNMCGEEARLKEVNYLSETGYFCSVCYDEVKANLKANLSGEY